jgi:hypothetical protein
MPNTLSATMKSPLLHLTTLLATTSAFDTIVNNGGVDYHIYGVLNEGSKCSHGESSLHSTYHIRPTSRLASANSADSFRQGTTRAFHRLKRRCREESQGEVSRSAESSEPKRRPCFVEWLRYPAGKCLFVAYRDHP